MMTRSRWAVNTCGNFSKINCT